MHSLLKVHLHLRTFSVFIDVERLEAGKFDNNLLQSIRQARHFLLVLTPNALDRCIGDVECKDWVHRVRENLQILYSLNLYVPPALPLKHILYYTQGVYLCVLYNA